MVSRRKAAAGEEAGIKPLQCLKGTGATLKMPYS